MKYSGKGPAKDRIWSLIVEYLPDDHVLHRALNRHKQECLGNIPRGRDGLDIQKILEGLLAEGGDKVKYLDSNEMWKDDNFRNKFSALINLPDVPEQVLLMTNDPLFQLF